MKTHFVEKLYRTPRLKRSDIFLTILPALLWLTAVFTRPYAMNLICAKTPEKCTKEQIFLIDRVSIGIDVPETDRYSYLTQNLSGAIALSIPVAWQISNWALAMASPVQALVALGTDWVVLIQAVAWNGLLTETAHLLSSRPRPFVYADPARWGSDPAQYTSFYSGHTSFAAVSMTSLLLLLLARGAPFWMLASVGIGAQTLIFLTGLFRILSGRHFISDVLCGAIAGVLIASWVALTHRETGPCVAS